MTVPEKILKLVEDFDSNIEKFKSLSCNEEDIKIDFINPFFEALGWDVRNKAGHPPDSKEVKFEDSVEVQGRIKNPDYSFRLERARKFFVEAKKPAVNIEGGISPAFQLRSYAWSADLPISILTDFEEFAVYDCRNEPFKLDKSAKSRLFIIKYYEFEKRWDEIASLFSKEAVQNGSLDKYLESIPAKRGSKKVDEALLEDISGWRESLAVNIAKLNLNLDQKGLNHAVQITIDRILFLRICEDRSIEDYGRLKKLLDGENVYQRLFELFEEADKKYNSGLFHFHPEEDRKDFDVITPSIKIDDYVLKNIIQGLYYPDSPYVFSEIPAEILGRVYEQFLGKVIQLTEDREVKVDYKPEVRKAGGVYYTPSYIVDYIVNNTVGKLLERKSPKEASELRILDPACGSGSFLIGAYQCLLDWHLDWYKGNLVPRLDAGQKLTSKEVQNLLPAPIEKPGKNAKARSRRIWERASIATLPIEQRGGEWHLRTAERKRILLNNIYGVDIDTQAVEVTKLSLLLKVLEGENKATIADLTMYSDERALPDLGNNIKCGNSLIGWDILDDNPNITQEELWSINPFDWQKGFLEVSSRGGFDVVIGNPPWGGLITKPEKVYLDRNYVNKRGESETHLFFIEKSFNVLNINGILGFITPNTWLAVLNSEELRNYLLSHANFYEIFELSKYIFVDAPDIVPILIFLGKLSETNETCIVKRASVIKITSNNFNSSFFVHRIDKTIWKKSLGSVINTRASIDSVKILEKCKLRACHLSDICDVLYGIKTGDNSKYLSPNKSDVHCYKALKTGELARYNIHWKGLYLWWCKDLAGYRTVTLEIPKIIIQYIRKLSLKQRIIAALDENGIYYPLNNYSYVSLKDGSNYSINYILGILNSCLLNYYYANTFIDYNIKPTYLSRLPIHNIDFSNPQDVALHNKMVSLVKRMLDLHRQLDLSMTEHEKTMLSRQIQATDGQIDSLVYELYGLTEEEIKIVESGKSSGG